MHTECFYGWFEGEDLSEAVRHDVERKAGNLVVEMIFSLGRHPNHLIGQVHDRAGWLEQLTDSADFGIDVVKIGFSERVAGI